MAIIESEGLYELALFAGGGGGLLGGKLLGFRTAAYVEWDFYAAEVLKARIRDGFLDDAPIWGDIRSFTSHNNACRRFIRELRQISGRLVVTAGFPCQPFSAAGKRLAEDDPRNGWPDTIRLIREIRPRYLLLENVPRLTIYPYFGRILGDLAESGYAVAWGTLSAAALGAPHLRERLWLVAYADREPRGLAALAEDGRQDLSQAGRGGEAAPHPHGGRRQRAQQALRPGGAFVELCDQDLADPHSLGWDRGTDPIAPAISGGGASPQGGEWWDVEPGLGRVAHGVAHRVDRIRALGNGQVPAVVRAAWYLLGERVRDAEFL